MDNQHKLITGYRDLSEAEIAMMNRIKAVADDVGNLCEDLAYGEKVLDQRWVAIGKTNLQQGFMALVRSVAKPESF